MFAKFCYVERDISTEIAQIQTATIYIIAMIEARMNEFKNLSPR